MNPTPPPTDPTLTEATCTEYYSLNGTTAHLNEQSGCSIPETVVTGAALWAWTIVQVEAAQVQAALDAIIWIWIRANG